MWKTHLKSVIHRPVQGVFFLWISLALPVSGANLLEEISQKSNILSDQIGNKKLSLILTYASMKDVCRLTELLNIQGVGMTTLMALEKVINMRFCFEETCNYLRRYQPC